MSHVTNHAPCVTYQVSGVTCHVLDKLVKIVRGGSVFSVVASRIIFVFLTRLDISGKPKLVARFLLNDSQNYKCNLYKK